MVWHKSQYYSVLFHYLKWSSSSPAINKSYTKLQHWFTELHSDTYTDTDTDTLCNNSQHITEYVLYWRVKLFLGTLNIINCITVSEMKPTGVSAYSITGQTRPFSGRNDKGMFRHSLCRILLPWSKHLLESPSLHGNTDFDQEGSQKKCCVY